MNRQSRHLSAAVMLALLSPAVAQPVDCDTQDNAGLSTLRLEVAGQDQVIGFRWAKHTYAVTLPAGSVSLELQAIEPSAEIRYAYLFDETTVEGPIEVGGGSAVLDVPLGSSTLIVSVMAGVTEVDYVIAIVGTASTCGDQVAVPPEECDDGNDADNDGCSSLCTLAPVIGPITKVVPAACSTVNDILDARPYELTVKPLTPIIRGMPFEVELSGKLSIPEGWLQVYVAILPGGTTELELHDLQATVEARDGASGAPVTLVRAQPYADGRCENPDFGACMTDADCGEEGICGEVVQMPLIDGMSDDCAACDARGLHDDCQQYGVCVAGPLELLLAPVQATFVADTFGEVLLGWHEAPISSEQWLLDDGGPNGIRFHLNSMTSGLLMGFECSMGTTDLGATVRIPLPDSDLVSLSIVAIPE